MFLIFLAIANHGISHTLEDMVEDRWNTVWYFWVLLSTPFFLTVVAFNLEPIRKPIGDWFNEDQKQ